MTGEKPSRKSRIWLIATLCVLALSLLATSAYNYLLAELCGNDQKNQLDSPDGELKAVIFSRDCGCTTSPSRQLSVLNIDANLPNSGGNTFIMDNGHSEAVSLVVSARWIENRRLSITYDGSARVFLAERSLLVPHFPLWQRVEIDYRKLGSTKL